MNKNKHNGACFGPIPKLPTVRKFFHYILKGKYFTPLGIPGASVSRIRVLGELVGSARGPIGIIFEDNGNIRAEIELGSPYEAKRFSFIFRIIVKWDEELPASIP